MNIFQKSIDNSPQTLLWVPDMFEELAATAHFVKWQLNDYLHPDVVECTPCISV